MGEAQSNIVPFGKYKGQPLEQMAQDREYVDWLLAQSWFVEKFQSLYTVIINNFQEPSETPEHNAMQVRFLQEGYRSSIANIFSNAKRVFQVGQPSFEIKGFDVCFVVTFIKDSPQSEKEKIMSLIIEIDDALKNPDIKSKISEKLFSGGLVHDRYWVSDDELKRKKEELFEILENGGTLSAKQLYCELKPVLSDNFPAFLRQIRDGIGRIVRDERNRFLLLVGAYTGKGAKWEDVVKIFKSSDIVALIEADAVLG